MKVAFQIIIALIITFTLGCYTYAQTASPIKEHPPNGHNSPYRIAFRDVNANPQYYDGQPLEIIGYLNLKFETDALWLNKESFDNYKKVDSLTKPIAVYFGYSKTKRVNRFNHHYVIIKAVFHIAQRGLGYFYNELEVKSIKRFNEKLPN